MEGPDEVPAPFNFWFIEKGKFFISLYEAIQRISADSTMFALLFRNPGYRIIYPIHTTVQYTVHRIIYPIHTTVQYTVVYDIG